MSGGQDEASERINVGDLPYWLAGPIKQLEARVERLEARVERLELSTKVDRDYASRMENRVQRLDREAEQRCKPPVCGRCNRKFVAGVNAYLPSCDCFAVNADGSVTLKDQGPNSEWAKEARKLAEWCANLEKWICEADKRIGSLDKQSEQLKTGNDTADGILSDLLQRVQRLEDGRPKQPAPDQPAKRREWWVVELLDGHVYCYDNEWTAKSVWEANPGSQRFRVIEAPTETETESAVNHGIQDYLKHRHAGTAIHVAIRKLLGGAS